MERDLNHDEHQFLVPGALLAREGLLPYRDYPLFHLPNLVFLYGAVDSIPLGPIFSAKVCSVVATALLGGLLILLARRHLPGSALFKLLLAGAGLLFLVCDPLFLYTSGKTWNHEVPTFLALCSLCLQLLAISRNALLLSILSGLLGGLSVGCRLTFAPVLVPLCLASLSLAAPLPRRLWMGGVFTLGATVALLPSFYFLLTSREAFLFDNFQFPRLRLLDPENTRIQKTMSWPRKLRYFFKEVVLPSWPLFAAYALLGIPAAWRWFKNRSTSDLGSALLLLSLPFLLLGCFAPSRYQYQHYYVFIPFLVMGVVLGIASGWSAPDDRRRTALIAFTLLLCAIANVGYRAWKKDGASSLEWARNSIRPAEWFPVRANQLGQQIRALAGPGKVLTLAPAWPLEGGSTIYPEFATGPFAWRSAHLMDPARRSLLRLIAPDDLEGFLTKDPPAAVLTGVEDAPLEASLVAYAKAHGYQPTKITRKRVLWLPPRPPAE